MGAQTCRRSRGADDLLLDDAASALAMLAHVAGGVLLRLGKLTRRLNMPDEALLQVLAEHNTGWPPQELPRLLAVLRALHVSAPGDRGEEVER